MDCRVKPGNDEGGTVPTILHHSNPPHSTWTDAPKKDAPAMVSPGQRSRELN